MKMPESQGYYPKLDDLASGRVKRKFSFVEARSDTAGMRPCDLRLGVKSQSSRVIAGSCRNRR